MGIRCPLYACAFVLTFAMSWHTADLFGDDWPAWRGADGQGISHEKGFPEKWSKTENIVWRTELPGPGNSTPIVSGGKVFITQAVDADNWRGTVCFDRTDGHQVWKVGLT